MNFLTELVKSLPYIIVAYGTYKIASARARYLDALTSKIASKQKDANAKDAGND